MICEFCKKELIRKDFETKSILYCDECFDSHQEYIACNHEFKYYLFELENGNKQLRMVCNICYYRDPKIIKQTPELLRLAKNKVESNFTEFRNRQSKDEYSKISEFTRELKLKQESIRDNNYQKYINSDQWKLLRKQILLRDKNKCQICGAPANHVHHLNYAHFMEEFIFELVSLCEDCHMKEYHSEVKAKFIEKIMYQKAIIKSIEKR